MGESFFRVTDMYVEFISTFVAVSRKKKSNSLGRMWPDYVCWGGHSYKAQHVTRVVGVS